jgi:membrane protein YqaA with SNARE-associated domain
VTDVAAPAAAGRLQRFFDKLRYIADRGWSGTAVFVYGVLQNLVVPGLADALYLPLALAQPRRAYRLAAFALAGTVVGASLLFWLGGNALAAVTDSYGHLVGVDAEKLADAERLLNKYGWLLVIGSAFSPISTKLLALSAGAFGMPYIVFMGALGAARTVRLLLFSWAIQRFGARAVREALGLRDDDLPDDAASIDDAATGDSATIVAVNARVSQEPR